MKESFNKYYNFIIIFLIALIIIAFFDRALALGLIVLSFLMVITFFVLSKLGLRNKTLFRLLIIALIIHLGVVLFIYYFDFQPLSQGVGGFRNCNLIAQSLAKNFRQGNFSFQGVPFYENNYVPYDHYGLIIGLVYTFTSPEMLIGQIFGVWLAVLATIFVYLIIRELGASRKWAFLIGLIVNFYPSYLFYSSLLLKDGLVVVLALAGLLFSLKLIKNFSWRYFLIFYLISGLLIHFRIYIGYALFFTFIVSWALLSRLKPLKKKLGYLIVIIVVLGFLPQISAADQGFYGINTFKKFFSEETIAYYQEEAYFPKVAPIPKETSSLGLTEKEILERDKSIAPIGYDSSWKREDGKEWKYFTYILFGPFPWQLKKPIHYLSLFEMIPWYILFLFVIKGIYQSIKDRKRLVLPLILFSLLVLIPITIFISNFGIITRIRVPAFIALLSLIPLGYTKLKKDHEQSY
jgi:4-amino-4-deoxy-L-arabinose transferase-like glycosyltransferase